MKSSQKKINNQEIYDEKWSAWTDMKQYGPASRWLRVLIDDLLLRINTSTIKTVLDVGSGEGTTTAHLAEKLPNAKVLGIDFSKSGIDISRVAYPFQNLEFTHDPNSEALLKQYDLVSSFEVLEHVEDWQDLLGRLAHASRKYLLFSFPTGRMRSFEKNVGHLRNFKKGEVEVFLESHGFKPVLVYYAGFPFYSPLYREVCNLTNSGNNQFTQGKYGILQKLASSIIYIYYLSIFLRKKSTGINFAVYS